MHFSHAVPKCALMLEHRLQYEHQNILSQVFKNHVPLSINTVFAFEGCPSVCSPFWMWQKTHPKTALPHKSDRNILLFPTQHVKRSADSLAFISLASDDITEPCAWDCFPRQVYFLNTVNTVWRQHDDVVSSNTPPCKIRKSVSWVDSWLNVTVLPQHFC